VEDRCDIFKTSEETWKLVWSGIATQEFIESSAWGVQPSMERVQAL